MCFVTRKKLKAFQDTLEATKASVEDLKTTEIGRLREDSKSLDELRDLLSNVSLKVKKVQAFEDGTVRIVYNLPTIILSKDSEGNWNKNNFFYATNMLGLLNLEDTRKIQKVLDSVN